MFKTLLLVLAVAVAAVLIYAALKPKSFALSRSAVIAAPPDRVFALIDDLHEFNEASRMSRPSGGGLRKQSQDL